MLLCPILFARDRIELSPHYNVFIYNKSTLYGAGRGEWGEARFLHYNIKKRQGHHSLPQAPTISYVI
jgi:hypothetical protein